MKSPGPTDEELMLAYQVGDEGAFVELFKRYNVRIFNYFLRHLGNRSMAEDLLQSTFLKVHRQRKSYRPSAAFSTWIFTIASNLLKDASLAQRRRGEVVQLEDVKERVAAGSSRSEPVLASSGKTPEVEYEEREIAEYIRQAVQSLPPDQRSVILLAKYEGFKYEEIAEILNITVSAAKVRVHRAMKALEQILKKRFCAL